MHIRLDAFFATVEQRRRPNLRGKPVIVTEPKGNTSGVVVSASREARKQSVKEAMSVRHAQRACPDAILFKADYPAYRLVFEEFLNMLSRYTPQLEPDSLGSAFMDITAGRNLFGDPSELCARIISEVSAHLDMPLCIGLAPNKLLAGIASGLGKGYVRVRSGNESGFLSPLPISRLAAVDGKIDKRLGELGVANIGQLAQISERVLVRQFGPVGNLIHKQAQGIDFSPVLAAYPEETIITEHPFCCPAEEPAEIEERLNAMAAECEAILRRRNTLAREILLAITACHSEQREESLPAYYTFKKPTDSAYTISQALAKLLGSMMEPGMEVSKVRIELSGLTRGESCQLSLIGPNERANRLNRVVELISDRFGDGAIFLATRQSQGSTYVSGLL